MISDGSVWWNGVRVDPATARIEISFADPAEISEPEWKRVEDALEGEVHVETRKEMSSDEWAVFAEHHVFSDEPGKL